jgi:hypothetical protein
LTDADKAASSESDEASEAKPHSFTLAEMVTCDACLRANPPTRARCLYCGTDLPVSTADQEIQSAGETTDRAANAVDGYYVVLTPNQTRILSEGALTEIAALLHLNTTEVQSVVDRSRTFPVARATTPEQAMKLIEKLRALGIDADTFTADGLALDSPIKKIRALEFSDDGLIAVPLSDGGRVSTPWDDLILIIAGRLLVNRVEVEERRRRGRPEPLDTRELFSDEAVLDLYTRSSDAGCRITSNGFDFSCLGDAKAMTAFENFTTLLSQLRERAPNVELDDSYVGLRPVLRNVWPLEAQTRKGDWRRSGAGKFDIATVTTTDNETQFNRYSRLRHSLKLRELDGSG